MKTLSVFALTLLTLLTLAVTTDVSAQSIQVQSTSGEFAISAPGDAPVGDAATALLTRTDAGAWRLQSLSPGDVPADIARSHGETLRVRTQGARRLGRTSQLGIGSIIDRDILDRDTSSSEVSYRIRGPLADASPDVLVRLSESDALVSFSVTGPDRDGQRQIEAAFAFASVAAWAQWNEQAATTALLDRLIDSDRQSTLSVRQ